MMKLLKSILVAALLVGLGMVIGRSSVNQPGSLPPVSDRSALLEKPVAALSIHQRTIREIVADISKNAGVDVRVNLKGPFGDVDEILRRFDLELPAGTLSQQLRLLCEFWNPKSSDQIDFGVMADDDIVMVAKYETLQAVICIVRVYDVRDLLEKIAKDIPGGPLQTSPGLFGPGSANWEMAWDALIAGIKANVRTDSWREIGAQYGSLTSYGDGILVVTQTPAAQQDLVKYLNTLATQIDHPIVIPTTQAR